MPIDGCAFGSLSMTAYTLGVDCPLDASETRPSADGPDSALVSPADTNL